MTVPRHVAIIMDGNGRWASRRGLPRSAGHKAGLKPVRLCVEECRRRGISYLTLFAFSSENWSRPVTEVGFLMSLFIETLEREIDDLARQSVEVRFIGDRSALGTPILQRIEAAEARCVPAAQLRLTIALAYGGRWDIARAARTLALDVMAGRLSIDEINESTLGQRISLGDIPDPDLFIRTGGEQRISNFLLWSLAYSELWFTERLWPEFDAGDFGAAMDAYAGRERRFGGVPAPREPAC
ncbi:MAG: polyprenyl diphosphate synthase [Pseudomonadota bacterium]|jgi:undecaprenyl diphosphate synthase